MHPRGDNVARSLVVDSQEDDIIVPMIFRELFVRAKGASERATCSRFVVSEPHGKMFLSDTIIESVDCLLTRCKSSRA